MSLPLLVMLVAAASPCDKEGGKSVSLVPLLKKFCPECGVTKVGFKAIAIGNIDDDDTLEVWTIDEKRRLVQLSDDLAH